MDYRRKIVVLAAATLVSDPFVGTTDTTQFLEPAIADSLGIPRDAVCIRSRHVWGNNNIEVLMQHDTFEPVPEGSSYPRHAA